MIKTWMVVVARHDLAEIHAELEPWLQAFLADHADGIREMFAAEFAGYYPQTADDYNTARVAAGGLLDQVLRPVDGERIDLEDFFEVGRADSGGLDRPADSRPGRLPLVVLELRELGRSKYDPRERPELRGRVDYPLMEEIVGELAGIARRGEAAAKFARALPESFEGELVAARLRQAVAAPAGAGRDRATRELRRAAGWYLARFPDKAEALKMTLGPVAEILGAPGGFGGDSR
jgi:hypothetical protein